MSQQERPPYKLQPLAIKKKEIVKKEGCIWFNLNFEIMLLQDSLIKRKGSEIWMGERKLRNDKNITLIRYG
jgi:hypothetical protein